ncbi:MAG: VPLPA-CTERM-specific exosortase XrtD [Pseudomonadota bacterium]
MASDVSYSGSSLIRGINLWGVFWLLIAAVGAGVFFIDGIGALLEAWQLPEYSHGPLIPILSGLLFLRQLKEFPVDPGPKRNRWVGVTVIVAAIAMGTLGNLANIGDIVAYAIILWVGGILLVSFGWSTGKHFWPPVLHLVYMLPLPGVVYYKLTTSLQLVSSELGVYFLQLMSVPVFLDGNIIDLGVMKLHVAEACSGLRYLFPILSFSYIFAVLYRGPMWHKAVLLISAAPITVLMNSVRIAVAGYIVNNYGADWVEGFTHFFEGWVIFIICVLLLFLLAWVLLFFRKDRVGLIDALDLDTDGLATQAARLRFTRASSAMIISAVLAVGAAVAWTALPDRGVVAVEREDFERFPTRMGEWRQIGRPRVLEDAVIQSLGADDYHMVDFASANAAANVNLFMAWYNDQSQGGVHSPEICLPGAGWEIAWLERTDLSAEMNSATPFNINRAIIQRGETRMMVFYWFEQKGRRIAWDFSAKFWLLADGVRTGRTDGALVRLTTAIQADETDAEAEARLRAMMDEVMKPLPNFIPTGEEV